jgi:hypothetical protein
MLRGRCRAFGLERKTPYMLTKRKASRGIIDKENQRFATPLYNKMSSAGILYLGYNVSIRIICSCSRRVGDNDSCKEISLSLTGAVGDVSKSMA